MNENISREANEGSSPSYVMRDIRTEKTASYAAWASIVLDMRKTEFISKSILLQIEKCPELQDTAEKQKKNEMWLMINSMSEGAIVKYCRHFSANKDRLSSEAGKLSISDIEEAFDGADVIHEKIMKIRNISIAHSSSDAHQYRTCIMHDDHYKVMGFCPITIEKHIEKSVIENLVALSHKAEVRAREIKDEIFNELMEEYKHLSQDEILALPEFTFEASGREFEDIRKLIKDIK